MYDNNEKLEDREFEVLLVNGDDLGSDWKPTLSLVKTFANLVRDEGLDLTCAPEKKDEGVCFKFRVCSGHSDPIAVSTENLEEHLVNAVAQKLPRRVVLKDEDSEMLRFIISRCDLL